VILIEYFEEMGKQFDYQINIDHQLNQSNKELKKLEDK